ncbi:MAG: hypothetical protein ACFFB8_17240 [Promethearchaeota archaeon]
MIFPEVIGQNLEFEKFNLPYNLAGKLNLVIIPFRRWHQDLVDQWSFYLNSLEEKYSNFKYYEIPTLNRGYKVMKFMIEGGMRAGIPDKKVRERTITIYVNKSQFKKELEIQTEDTIHLFLINKKGEIIWHTEGQFNLNKTKALENILSKHTS